jgi:hypothetical protein
MSAMSELVLLVVATLSAGVAALFAILSSGDKTAVRIWSGQQKHLMTYGKSENFDKVDNQNRPVTNSKRATSKGP